MVTRAGLVSGQLSSESLSESSFIPLPSFTPFSPPSSITTPSSNNSSPLLPGLCGALEAGRGRLRRGLESPQPPRRPGAPVDPSRPSESPASTARCARRSESPVAVTRLDGQMRPSIRVTRPSHPPRRTGTRRKGAPSLLISFDPSHSPDPSRSPGPSPSFDSSRLLDPSRSPDPSREY